MTYEELQAMYVKKDDIRDRFAMAALIGIMTRGYGGSLCNTVARDAYRFADAMLTARKVGT